MTNMSHSRLECYNLCGKKYFYKYVEKLYLPEISSPLLFGSAIDEALNYILECEQNGKKDYMEQAHKTFQDEMYNYPKGYTIGYLKSDISCYLLTDEDLETFGFPMLLRSWTQKNQEQFIKELDQRTRDDLSFTCLLRRGTKFIDAWVENILPEFDEILEVQTKYSVENGEGDKLVFILDFRGKLKDGRIVTCDNKTSSRPYEDDSVIISPQLSTYTEFTGDEYAAYAVLDKKIRKDGIIRTQFIVDRIDPEFRQHVFSTYQEGIENINNKIFEKNEDSCYSFGRQCEYHSLCQHNNMGKLLKKENK